MLSNHRIWHSWERPWGLTVFCYVCSDCWQSIRDQCFLFLSYFSFLLKVLFLTMQELKIKNIRYRLGNVLAILNLASSQTYSKMLAEFMLLLRKSNLEGISSPISCNLSSEILYEGISFVLWLASNIFDMSLIFLHIVNCKPKQIGTGSHVFM